jgi:hypothetical protein
MQRLGQHALALVPPYTLYNACCHWSASYSADRSWPTNVRNQTCDWAARPVVRVLRSVRCLLLRVV